MHHQINRWWAHHQVQWAKSQLLSHPYIYQQTNILSQHITCLHHGHCIMKEHDSQKYKILLREEAPHCLRCHLTPYNSQRHVSKIAHEKSLLCHSNFSRLDHSQNKNNYDMAMSSQIFGKYFCQNINITYCNMWQASQGQN